VYNLGVPGDTTKELLERIDAEAKAREPNLIIITIGNNDSISVKPKKRQMVPLEQFQKNLEKLIKKAKKFTGKIVLLGCTGVDEAKTTPIPWQTDFHYTNDNLKKYDEKIKEAAVKSGCYYFGIFDLLQPEHLEDGLHPNAKGHEKLFLAVKDFLDRNGLI
ncbi:MAG: SGNH/GDSL hydrolase family protein, partial [Nanoarchaeota archaeon]|nr:SGNH/GDSL hydrolase family protein [Nanoarchaeota archaeon]